MDKAVLQEYLFKEVELAQDIIGRMGNNSFLIKGAAVTLVAAALLVQGTLYDNFIALLPISCILVFRCVFPQNRKLIQETIRLVNCKSIE